jgi:hypothetical protein
MALDPKNRLTATNLILNASRATNNTAGLGVDLKGYTTGPVAVVVDFGTKTAGDNDGTVTVQLQSATTNSAAAATNVSGASTNTSNNATATNMIQLDPRAVSRYLFGRIILTGTNSPAYPVSAVVIGEKQVQS